MKRYFCSLALTTFMSMNINLFAQSAMIFKDVYKEHMMSDLNTIKHTLEVSYAPTHWKQSHVGWSLNEEYELAKQQIVTNPHLTMKQYYQILNQFIGAVQDYHVDVLFYSTEAALLPFNVKGVNGRYFINWLDDEIAKKANIQIGDELVTFGGRPVDEVVSELKVLAGAIGNTQTDQALAEMRLTVRIGARGEEIPKGPIDLLVKSKTTGQSQLLRMEWHWLEEVVKSPLDVDYAQASLLDGLLRKPEPKKLLKTHYSMLSPLANLYPSLSDGRWTLGSYQSFLPKLGPVKWKPSYETPFDIYVYKHPSGASIGYIRIPDYQGSPEDAETFGMLLNELEKRTDALVIDQLNNPGGFALYLYSLVSMLADQTFEIPKHRLTLTQENVVDAYNDLRRLTMILKMIDEEEEDVESFFSEGDYFKTYEYLLLSKNFCQFLIDQWNKGKGLTDLTYLEGVDTIKPNERYRYTKPIVMLINELDVSAGDFMPAILQDNKRAVLFGNKTSGAGGCVRGFQFPNLTGIETFRYTCSIAERPSGRKIENLGVIPDVAYQVTEEDVQHNYRSYVKAVNRTVQDLLSAQKKR